MKFFSMRWVVVASLIGFGAAGVVSSNVGCGDSDATGSGGSGGSGGGAGGSGGSAVVPRYADTFDTDKEMWTLSTYVDTNYKNLGAASDPDSGVSLDGGMVPTLEWSGACGDPSPGCLKLTVTFSGFKEYVDPQVNVATDGPAAIALMSRFGLVTAGISTAASSVNSTSIVLFMRKSFVLARNCARALVDPALH